MPTNSATKTIYLKDYQAPLFSIESVELNFDLQKEQTIVTNKMRVRRSQKTTPEQPLHLDGRQLELLKVTLDDKILSPDLYEVDAGSLTINGLPQEFVLEIVTGIDPTKNTSLEGLYASGAMFCSQCEPHGFSCITS